MWGFCRSSDSVQDTEPKLAGVPQEPKETRAVGRLPFVFCFAPLTHGCPLRTVARSANSLCVGRLRLHTVFGRLPFVFLFRVFDARVPAPRTRVGGLGGPGRPGNLPKRWGARPPAFLEGFPAARGRPDPQSRRFPVGQKIKYCKGPQGPLKGPRGPLKGRTGHCGSAVFGAAPGYRNLRFC